MYIYSIMYYVVLGMGQPVIHGEWL